jgi:DNA-binding NarL/FixJ family response regulator
VVVCLTAEATDDERAAVLAAGAGALVQKGAATADLADAVRSAFRDAREPA